MAPVIVFMGRPGSGKGTQAKLLSDATGIEYYGTGALLRSLAKEDTVVGKKIAETIDGGGLMPHWFASHMVVGKLLESDPTKGLIIDGSNRTLPEAELFEAVTTWLSRPYVIVYLSVSEEHIIQRLQKRSLVSGREDDDSSAIMVRISEYDTETLPALDFHTKAGKVLTIDGERSIEEIQLDIATRLTPFLKS